VVVAVVEVEEMGDGRARQRRLVERPMHNHEWCVGRGVIAMMIIHPIQDVHTRVIVSLKKGGEKERRECFEKLDGCCCEVWKYQGTFFFPHTR